MDIFPFPQDRSHFGVVLLGLLATASLVALLWMGSDQGHTGGGRSAGEHEGTVPGVSNICTGLLWEGTCSRGLAGGGVSAGDHGVGCAVSQEVS